MTRLRTSKITSLVIAFCILIFSLGALIDLWFDYFKLQNRLSNYGERIHGLSEYYPHTYDLILPVLPYITHLSILLAIMFLYGSISSLQYLVKRNKSAAYALGISCVSYGAFSVLISFTLSSFHASMVQDGRETNIPEAQLFLTIAAVLFLVAGGIVFFSGAQRDTHEK